MRLKRVQKDLYISESKIKVKHNKGYKEIPRIKATIMGNKGEYWGVIFDYKDKVEFFTRPYKTKFEVLKVIKSFREK